MSRRLLPKMLFALKLLSLSLWLSSASLHADPKSEAVRGAYLTKGLSALSYKDGRLAYEIWMKELSANEDLTFEVDFYDSPSMVLAQYQGSQVKLVGINPLFYFQKQQAYDTLTGHLFVAKRSGDIFEKMVLLVRKDSGIDSFSALKGKRVVRAVDNLMGDIFLDMGFLKELHVQSEGYIKEMSITKKDSTAILKTYFGKADACVVPEFAFRLATEMNPSLGKELSVLSESPSVFMPVLVLIHKDADQSLFHILKHSSSRLQQRPRGQHILALFKMKELVDLPLRQLGPSKQYYNEYLRLRQHYGGDDE